MLVCGVRQLTNAVKGALLMLAVTVVMPSISSRRFSLWKQPRLVGGFGKVVSGECQHLFVSVPDLLDDVHRALKVRRDLRPSAWSINAAVVAGKARGGAASTAGVRRAQSLRVQTVRRPLQAGNSRLQVMRRMWMHTRRRR